MYLNFNEDPFPSVNENVESYTASIETDYPQLNDSWTEATQLTDKSGNILSRSYSNLIFPTLPGYLQRIELSSFDDIYEADYYFLLMNYFYEDYYTSSDNFTRWTKIRSTIRQERTYKPTQTSCFFYERPFTLVTDINGDYKDYSPLQTTLVKVYVGNAIGMTVECPDPITVYKKDTSDGPRISEVTGMILCDREWLEVEFTPITPTIPQLVTSTIPCSTETSLGTNVSHTYITFKSYGEYLWANYDPVEIAEPEVLVYPIETPISQRRTPPGLTVREDFWNNNLSQVPLTNINSRLSINPYIL